VTMNGEVKDEEDAGSGRRGDAAKKKEPHGPFFFRRVSESPSLRLFLNFIVHHSYFIVSV
jgi:hypothetical protein